MAVHRGGDHDWTMAARKGNTSRSGRRTRGGALQYKKKDKGTIGSFTIPNVVEDGAHEQPGKG